MKELDAIEMMQIWARARRHQDRMQRTEEYSNRRKAEIGRLTDPKQQAMRKVLQKLKRD